jgi:hypothetical protein
MLKYLAPLGIFVGGNLLLLVGMLLFPAINTANTQLIADTAPIAATFWGWTWVTSGTRLWVFLFCEGAILWTAGKAFLGLRKS